MRIIHRETSTYSNILRVIGKSKSKIFYIEDFTQCGTYTSIRSDLVRLEQSGVLIRLARGIYMHKCDASKFTIPEIVDLILENLQNRKGKTFFPVGLFLLYKAGIIDKLPEKIEIAYGKNHPRVINLFSNHHICFKYTPSLWLCKIEDPTLRNLLIVLLSKWKEEYCVKKEDVIKQIASQVETNNLIKNAEIIPPSLLRKCKSLLNICPATGTGT